MSGYPSGASQTTLRVPRLAALPRHWRQCSRSSSVRGPAPRLQVARAGAVASCGTTEVERDLKWTQRRGHFLASEPRGRKVSRQALSRLKMYWYQLDAGFFRPSTRSPSVWFYCGTGCSRESSFRLRLLWERLSRDRNTVIPDRDSCRSYKEPERKQDQQLAVEAAPTRRLFRAMGFRAPAAARRPRSRYPRRDVQTGQH